MLRPYIISSAAYHAVLSHSEAPGNPSGAVLLPSGNYQVLISDEMADQIEDQARSGETLSATLVRLFSQPAN